MFCVRKESPPQNDCNCSGLAALERELSRVPASEEKELRAGMKKAIKAAANQFSKHVDAHPARALWEGARVFNPRRKTIALDNGAPFGLHLRPDVSQQLCEYQKMEHTLGSIFGFFHFRVACSASPRPAWPLRRRGFLGGRPGSLG